MRTFSGLRGLGEAAVTAAPVAAAPEYHEEAAEYVISRNLTAGQELLDQALQIEGDSDFVLMGLKGTKTGEYEIRFKLPSGRYLSSARVRASNAIGTAQFPVPILPAIVFSAGSNLGFDIKDLSAAPNSVQIVLIGTKRLRSS